MLVEMGGFVAGVVSGDIITGRLRPTTIENPRTILMFYGGLVPTAGLIIAHQTGLINPGVEFTNAAIGATMGYYSGGLLHVLRTNPGLTTNIVRAILHR